MLTSLKPIKVTPVVQKWLKNYLSSTFTLKFDKTVFSLISNGQQDLLVLGWSWGLLDLVYPVGACLHRTRNIFVDQFTGAAWVAGLSQLLYKCPTSQVQCRCVLLLTDSLEGMRCYRTPHTQVQRGVNEIGEICFFFLMEQSGFIDKNECSVMNA